MNHTEPTPRSASHRNQENAPMLTPTPPTNQTAHQTIHQNRQETTTMTSLAPSHRPLLTVRALAVLLLAAFVGTVAGLLTFAATHDLPTAVGAGLGAAGTVTMGHNTLVE